MTDPLARLLAGAGGDRLRVVVVVAHPDDEVLGCGALLARLAAVRVVHVTDGAPRNLADARRHGFATREAYAARRAAEAETALALAGHPAESLVRLGIADQEASLHLTEVARALVPLLGGVDMVFTHAYEGGHSDHDAVAFAVDAAIRLLGRTPLAVEMPFYRAALECDEAAGTGAAEEEAVGWVRQCFVPRVDAGPPHRLTLDDDERRLKRRMIAAHATQKATLDAFSVTSELFRVAPRYDFSELPHPGPLLYERHGWNLTGLLWRDRVRAARAALGWTDRP